MTRIKLFRKWLLPFLAATVFILAVTLSGLLSLPARSSFAPGSAIPTEAEMLEIATPDWAKITLRTLPAILKSGSFQAPDNLISILGYDPSRTWEAGQTANQYMRLGDFQESFQLQQFSIRAIGELVGLDPQLLRLADLALSAWQTLRDLTQAVPSLEDLPIGDVAPLADLLAGAEKLAAEAGISLDNTIGEVIQNEALADLSLGALDLSQYSLDSIPGLANVALERFQDWQKSIIDQIPGLADVPFANFPNPIANLGVVVGKVDTVFGPKEADRRNTISGSYVEGFNVVCQSHCAHLELSEPELVRGTQWISGQYQQVRGGRGPLAQANGGLEPTGRHPFGNAFKIAVMTTDEASGRADTGLYFRLCIKHAFVDLGCTPYFIGPIPWLPIQEEGTIILGQIKEGLSTTQAAKVAAAKGIDPTTGQPKPKPSPNSGTAPTNGKASPTSGPVRFIHPAPGYPITSNFGWRIHPRYKTRRFHSGTDWGTPAGTIIRASAGGQVTFARISGSLTSGYGRLVIIDHGNGYKTYYAHLQGFFVREGDLVEQGKPVGRADSTGLSTGHHLHFEIRQNGQPQNPLSYIQ